ncbi:NAD-dependent epimerase/dehydratase family protein [Sorangium sp. So ce693]|uniref:NAD-dependent epimerase/dehydratase family protein n=1 Tax=Sorangium sp. So ce693 TaxID=3133318 RepID=UPI003F6026D5
MTSHVLITGGAGFIGSHVADELLRQGVRVRALDSLVPQVHGPDRRRPAYLDPEVELIVGDVRDREAVRSALRGVDAVVHFASAVGVGQSMYKIAEYTSINNVGTAVLLEELAEKPVSRLLVASSMSVYGEGLYRTASGAVVPGVSRPLEQLRRGDWEVRSEAGEALVPIPTPESKPPSLESVYALSKYDQERLCLMIGRAYQIPTVALRFFNVYGRRQALSNPYTGVLAIFAARLLNGRPPVIFEDGLQRRDLVSVTDVARACVRALGADAAIGQVLNIGSGRSTTVREVAERVREVMGKSGIEPEIVGKSRLGDVRHCFADIGAAQQKIGYAPRVSLEEGLRDLADWLEGQVAKDAVAQARAELESRGLTV